MTAMVPNVIHHIVGPKGNGLTDRCLNSWQILKDFDFEIRVWTDESITEFISEYHPFALAAFLNARNHAEAADIARYLIVHEFGGYYMDWDVQLIDLAKFLTIVENFSSGYLIQDPINHTLASEAFSALKHEQFLLGLVDNIVFIFNNNFRDILQTPQYSGPYRMRDYYYFCKKKTKQRIIKVKDIFLYDYTEIRDMPTKTTKTAMIHYWMHSWIPAIK
ncbi:glycosyltransferase [Pedobacter miscanthi]|uniref:glycosyltransferase n=1 Tax=Pedobacter miscanthi TaxID=2259170 RepID=UPI00292F7244|nr:glycosyltransferase [Pedobacter miscanthi]